MDIVLTSNELWEVILRMMQNMRKFLLSIEDGDVGSMREEIRNFLETIERRFVANNARDDADRVKRLIDMLADGVPITEASCDEMILIASEI